MSRTGGPIWLCSLAELKNTAQDDIAKDLVTWRGFDFLHAEQSRPNHQTLPVQLMPSLERLKFLRSFNVFRLVPRPLFPGRRLQAVADSTCRTCLTQREEEPQLKCIPPAVVRESLLTHQDDVSRPHRLEQ
jgi:hypothetical protein